MAKSNWGITSGFIGKLGNVVGYNWKGKNIQRAYTQSAQKSVTKEQTLQRTRFAIVTRAGSDLYEAVYEGFRREAGNLRTTQNGLFVKYNFDNVIGDDAAALVLDYEHLQLSSGKLRGVEFGEASLAGNVISVQIVDSNLIGRRVSASDRVYLVAYCPELRDAKCVAVGTRVDSSALTLTLPAKWADKRVYAYAFTVGAASFNDGLASATSFLGSFGSTESSSSGSSGSNSGTSETPGTSGTSETPTVAAPVIRGTTPFEESTEVTITGPAGAEIRYTVDGSQPTAQSTLYSDALRLTDTTTVKAIAIKDGVSSSVTTNTFTKGSGEEDPDTE